MLNKTCKKQLVYPLVLLVIIVVVTYFSRWVFSYHFEPEYWENYYYESQWNVPNSSRVIPDGGVYRYVGYRLVNGENPFNVDYWVPPLGKYLYGISAKFFHNPYLTSYAFYLLSLVVFYLLAETVFPKGDVKWFALYLFALNPQILEQISKTMLDLPLTFFMLLSFVFLYRSTDQKSHQVMAIFSGLSLGLMAGVKPPYFVPMIAFFAFLFFYRSKKIKNIFYFLPSIVFGYLMAYFCYFVKHPNPIPWLRLHEKIIDFHRGSGGSHNSFELIKLAFTAHYTGFWVGAKNIYINTWSVLQPLGLFVLFYLTLPFKYLKRKHPRILHLLFVAISYLIMISIIDFWPRYLIPIIPIYSLLVAYVFRKKKIGIIIILLLYVPSLFLFFFPSSSNFVKDFKQQINAGLYKETYELLSEQTKKEIGRESWQELSPALTEQINKDTEGHIIQAAKEGNTWRMKVKL